MADKTPKMGENALESGDRVLYKELSSGVYAQGQASAVMVGTSLVSASNPMPTTAVFSNSSAITPTHTVANVGIANTAVIGANANRTYLMLINDSDTTIYINLGNNAVLNQGIRLNAYGGAYEISAAIGNLYTGLINGIQGDAGTKVLLLTEGE